MLTRSSEPSIAGSCTLGTVQTKRSLKARQCLSSMVGEHRVGRTMIRDWMGNVSDDPVPSSAVVTASNHLYQTALLRLRILNKVPFRARYYVADATLLRPGRTRAVSQAPASQFRYILKRVFDSKSRPALQRCPYDLVLPTSGPDVSSTYEVVRHVSTEHPQSSAKVVSIYPIERPTKEELQILSHPAKVDSDQVFGSRTLGESFQESRRD